MYKCDFKSHILFLTLKKREISFTKENSESVCSIPNLGAEVVYRRQMNREVPGELNLLALERTVICRCIEEARFVAYFQSFLILLDPFHFVLLDSHCAFRPAPGALWRIALRLMETVVCLEDRSPWELTSSLLIF